MEILENFGSCSRMVRSEILEKFSSCSRMVRLEILEKRLASCTAANLKAVQRAKGDRPEEAATQ